MRETRLWHVWREQPGAPQMRPIRTEPHLGRREAAEEYVRTRTESTPAEDGEIVTVWVQDEDGRTSRWRVECHHKITWRARPGL